MFTGIIEDIGKVTALMQEDSNLRLTVEASFSKELKEDDSVSHNGVCLTVVKVNDGSYDVVCVDETLKRSNLGKLKRGDTVNLERSLKIGNRLDGHFVQGHVDETAKCNSILNNRGSWVFGFDYAPDSKNIVVEKGSVCVNGVSLTVVHCGKGFFSVAIIPYTFEHTTFKNLKLGEDVNIEFDIIGKYVAGLMNNES
jgi:riboflavin synthase